MGLITFWPPCTRAAADNNSQLFYNTTHRQTDKTDKETEMNAQPLQPK